MYGFRSYTSTGYIQLDNMYTNFTLISSGVLERTSSEWLAGVTINFPTQPVLPLIFLNSDSGSFFAEFTHSSAKIYGVGWYPNGSATIATTGVRFKIFGLTSYASLNTNGLYGLNLYNGAGELTYTSTQEHLKIQGVVPAVFGPEWSTYFNPSPDGNPVNGSGPIWSDFSNPTGGDIYGLLNSNPVAGFDYIDGEGYLITFNVAFLSRSRVLTTTKYTIKYFIPGYPDPEVWTGRYVSMVNY